MCPPSAQSGRAKNAANDASGLKMTPLEMAQQSGSSSMYWSHNLVNTSHLGAITSISCNENGLVAIASEDQSISVVHLSALLAELSTSKSPLGALLSASVQSKLDLESLTVPTIRLHEHTQGVVQIKILNDGRVFSISKDHTLKISDAASATRIASFTFPSALTCFALSANEETVYVGGQDGNIYKVNLWDIVSKPSASSQSISASNAFGANYDWTSSITSSLAEWAEAESDIDPSSMMDATVAGTGSSYSKSKSGNLIDVEPNAYRGHSQPISSISLSFDGSRIVSSAMDGIVIIWDERTCQSIQRVSPVKGVGVAWSTLLCRPSLASSNHSKLRLDASQREKSSLPFALVQKPQTSVGASFGYITVPLGDITQSTPSTAQHPSIVPSSFINIDFTPALLDTTSISGTNDLVDQIGLDLAGRLAESHQSEVENLREEVARLKAMNEKWKQVNNSLFSSTLSSTLK
jgi:WD40 repeat protein